MDATAHRMVSSVINATFILALAFIVVGEFFAGPLTRLVAPGFQGEVYVLTVAMTRIMFPMVLFLSTFRPLNRHASSRR